MGDAAPSAGEFKLVGAKQFKRHNPLSDRFKILAWDHLEFWVADATITARRFCAALGLQLIARSDVTTGNELYSSYVMTTNEIKFVFTAPMGHLGDGQPSGSVTFPHFNRTKAHEFIRAHGFACRAIALLVEDAAVAWKQCVENGMTSVLEPLELLDETTGGIARIAEVVYHEDVVFRWVSKDAKFTGPMLPGYVTEPPRAEINYGLRRIDHVVVNCAKLADVVPRVMRGTGLHEFAEFIADDVGTTESGLNSLVLASNSEMILLPVNEPVFGMKRKSQIQSFVEYNEGAGVQHIALKTDDIFATLDLMLASGRYAGFEFVPKPPPSYYAELPARLGDACTPEQYAKCEQYGVLGDVDPEGTLLQIFTRPVCDRPTVFFEIIQRIGCGVPQKPGCGGFGKGNFAALFKSIEDFEKQCEQVKMRSTTSVRARSLVQASYTIVDAPPAK